MQQSDGSATPLSLDLGEAGFSPAAWTAQLAASPASVLAYDDSSAAAVYSPLRASMRHQAQRQPFAFGDSMAAGPPALASPPHGADVYTGSRPPSRASLRSRQGLSRGSACDAAAAYDASAYADQPGAGESQAVAQTTQAESLSIHHEEAPAANFGLAAECEWSAEAAMHASWEAAGAAQQAAAAASSSRPGTGSTGGRDVQAAVPPAAQQLGAGSREVSLQARAVYTGVAAPGLLGHGSVPVKVHTPFLRHCMVLEHGVIKLPCLSCIACKPGSSLRGQPEHACQ